jgi:hypothetical protein
MASLFTAGCGGRRIQQYMRPYDALASRHATEQQVIAQEGKPDIVLKTDADLRGLATRFKPYTAMPAHVESKVLVYYADPWHDGEGYVVYVFLDGSHRACTAVFGG